MISFASHRAITSAQHFAREVVLNTNGLESAV